MCHVPLTQAIRIYPGDIRYITTVTRLLWNHLSPAVLWSKFIIHFIITNVVQGRGEFRGHAFPKQGQRIVIYEFVRVTCFEVVGRRGAAGGVVVFVIVFNFLSAQYPVKGQGSNNVKLTNFIIILSLVLNSYTIYEYITVNTYNMYNILLFINTY